MSAQNSSKVNISFALCLLCNRQIHRHIALYRVCKKEYNLLQRGSERSAPVIHSQKRPDDFRWDFDSGFLVTKKTVKEAAILSNWDGDFFIAYDFNGNDTSLFNFYAHKSRWLFIAGKALFYWLRLKALVRSAIFEKFVTCNVLGDCFIILSDCVYMTAQICTHITEHDVINSADKIAAYFKNKK